jgi:hypothetical protein
VPPPFQVKGAIDQDVPGSRWYTNGGAPPVSPSATARLASHRAASPIIEKERT